MIRWLLGGRPMIFMSELFTDLVSGKKVNIDVDRYGRFWMANNRWSKFRVEKSKGAGND